MKDMIQKSVIIIWILILPNIIYASGVEGYISAFFIIFSITFLGVLLTVFIISSFLLNRGDFSLTKNIILRILFSINTVLIATPSAFILSAFASPWMSEIVWPVLLIIFSIINFRSFLKKAQLSENPFRFHIFILSWFMLLIFLPYLYIIWFI